jgi:hypothetical protein
VLEPAQVPKERLAWEPELVQVQAQAPPVWPQQVPVRVERAPVSVRSR